MTLREQKFLLNSLILCINVILISTFIIYEKEWYVYLFILILSSMLNASSSILNILFKMYNPQQFNSYRLDMKRYLYVVPCYNESEEELKNSIHSLIKQRIVEGDERLILIICDGKVKGHGNQYTTDVILQDMLNINGSGESYNYTTWNGTNNTINIFNTTYSYKRFVVPIILIIKENNYGKRDSLVLIRRLCLSFNNDNNDDNIINNILEETFSGKIDYIIGIDGDTIFDYNCTYELIEGIEKDKNIHGCVGFVDIYPKMNMYSLFVMYQYAEYTYAQCLKRHAQSNITNKVSCLSGCNQILRVSEETCGEKILKVFNYCPNEKDNILTHIRSYASEDRNHVCNMLSLYPHVKTTQALKAISYTIVPTSISVFLSQRRRWNLGAITNDMLLVYKPGINIFERISAAVNIFTFSVSPFIFVATIYFIKSIIKQPTMLMLYLSIIIFVPFFYSLMIPIFIKPAAFTYSMYYYLSYFIFVFLCGPVSLTTFLYAILNMDNISWGKTRFIDSASMDNRTCEILEDGFIDDNYIEVIDSTGITSKETTKYSDIINYTEDANYMEVPDDNTKVPDENTITDDNTKVLDDNTVPDEDETPNENKNKITDENKVHYHKACTINIDDVIYETVG